MFMCVHCLCEHRVCVCISLFVCACRCVCVCACLSMHVFVCVCALHMFVLHILCLCLCVHKFVCLCVQICVCMCLRVYWCVCVHHLILVSHTTSWWSSTDHTLFVCTHKIMFIFFVHSFRSSRAWSNASTGNWPGLVKIPGEMALPHWTPNLSLQRSRYIHQPPKCAHFMGRS